ncbi:sulfite reductase [Ancylobacter novellus DSM 506]|uniref:Sulfite reductase n=1 Tax=Ancylobacter novellus (strain ATCC 8093 / DSM 506 / JCM 20403 / CCM 1077 / IAM 12100 / NBRC 12443 / NCIMB 10456) TaxID=639283 RepID=D7A4I0_ANCN5|nr:PepSY domain-containing protein [Ancylobacter novellus]ADH89843.1 sulfite reductase [Ancylobacter novellus DSM 506]
MTATATPAASVRAVDLYRAVWRWHFYAGLMVLPFMILLSVTGGLYLFRDEIDGLVHRDLKLVATREAPAQAPSAWIDAALAARPDTALKVNMPATPDASAEVVVKTAEGERRSVYVDPYDSRVLGELPDRGTVMWIVRRLHSLAEFGTLANGVIEIVGGWSILLVGTGFYLWWPRKQAGGVLTVRGTPRRRVFWRDLHAVTGAVAGLAIGFMSLSGMPWSVFWGAKVNEWVNSSNYGYPAGLYVDVPMSDEHLAHANGPTAWSLEQARMPESSPAPGQPIGIDEAAATFDRLGVAPGYALSLPGGPTGVYSAAVYPDDLSKQRVVHLDQYSGKPLLDMSYADYGPAAKAMEWGINVHMGQEFGLANQLLMLAVCLAILLMSVSAGVMWWKRRPKGSLGIPPAPSDPSVMRGLIALMAVVGLIFPLVGASLLAMVLLDLAFARRRPRTRTA